AANSGHETPSPGNRKAKPAKKPPFITNMSSQDNSSSYLQQMTSMFSSMASYMRLPVLISSGVAAVLSSLLYFKQKALIYPSHIPNLARTEVPRPSQFGITDFEELMIPTPDGEKLSAFYIRGPKASSNKNRNTTVLMFHGNAGNIGHRVPIARMFVKRMGCNVFMLEYRGYGLSTGSPDEVGLMIDAQTAYDYLRRRAETRNNDIVVFGQSLGGAVSIQLAAKNQHDERFSGLVLENTFLSMRKLIPSIIPPAKYLAILCHQVWPSDTFIPSITELPILFLSGLQDEIVPPSHMRRLFEISQSPTKVWKPLPGGDHNTSVLEEGYFESIEDFIANLETKNG
ncbi:Protein bem46, partial [Lachnellula willkommii]